MMIRCRRSVIAGLFACLAAGAASALDASPAGSNPSGSADCSRRIAITLDDLPFADQKLSFDEQKRGTAALLHALTEYEVPATGFVNEDKLFVDGEVSARIGLLRNWLNAGMTLGNHGFGHLDLQTTPLPEAEAAVLQGEVVTRWLTKQHGEAPRYYRYPYNHTGPTKEIKAEFAAFLARYGYAVAPYTVQNDDYLYDEVYNYDLRHQRKNEARRVREAYVAHLSVMMPEYEKMAEELFGRPIAQIFDLHADRINADALGTMLGALQQRGYCFVSLREALEDPAYDTPDRYVGPYGMSWLARWSKTGWKAFTVVPSDPQAWVIQRYKAITAAAKAAAGQGTRP